jgi:hypothetical protein
MLTASTALIVTAYLFYRRTLRREGTAVAPIRIGA